jgi:nucleoside-diphosphate-sugar epimerase
VKYITLPDAKSYSLSYITSVISSYLETFTIPINISKIFKKLIQYLTKKETYKSSFINNLIPLINNTYINTNKIIDTFDYQPEFDLKSGLENSFKWYIETLKK